MANKIKNPESLTLEQKLEAARLLEEMADMAQTELDDGTRPKINPKTGEVISGAALSPLDVRRKREDVLSYRLEAIALRGSAQENDLAALRRRLASVTRRAAQLEQLCRMHGLKMPGYADFEDDEGRAMKEVAATPPVVEAAKAEAVEVAVVETPKKAEAKPRVKAAAKTKGKAAVIAPKGEVVYEPRYR